MRTRWLVGGLVLVVLAGLGYAGSVVWGRAHRTDLERAVSLVPAATQRLSFTDWAAVRRSLHVPTTAAPSPTTVTKWLNRAYDRDLSTVSSISDSARALAEHYGWSPGNADWEAYAQAGSGSAMVLRMADQVSFDALAGHLRELGYTKPSSETGVWLGGADLVGPLDPSLTPEVQYVVLLADQHLVISSDTASYAETAARAAQGKGASLAATSSVTDMIGRIGEPGAAMIWARDFACKDLAMAHADRASQRQADQLIAAAGRTSPLSGLVMALSPGRVLTIAEEFESSDQARENLRARARLAVGEAVGRGESTFNDDLKLTASKAVGSTVLLTMRPRSAGVFPLSSLYSGPVIFATC
ncbi:hypothetical protein [Nocardioides terrisoli]|uniref:hypothetical protein n=1 Tax=Nocardioides terrisoli TaxID=3388267 RepID=UPI00287BC85B|nr:hypothetical protein [Nocardioides marmorisolisilvae]